MLAFTARQKLLRAYGDVFRKLPAGATHGSWSLLDTDAGWYLCGDRSTTSSPAQMVVNYQGKQSLVLVCQGPDAETQELRLSVLVRRVRAVGVAAPLVKVEDPEQLRDALLAR